ncbi:GNAT family N-acetyltransferase [Phormidium sp. FACHB-1136]|uniref:GNAT family N-acetyltransferase n=1 Tax=Phormidium sp. FACHB-1136 TaxID=2692848 RepID=UPI001681FFB6|nr:GNAT family N-acetyltransferase [Phormidium sp. FACHB-1136]MBD2426310.1 GNAT family N-acetyltransferase [Phormidium sp. FACHB-1136]
MSSFSIPGYHLRLGSPLDRATLVKFMERTYQELGEASPLKHLAATVDRYLSCDTPLWMVERPGSRGSAIAVGCIWLGQATDQRSGLLHPYVLLLYVHPDHRRRGLATELLHTAHQWATAEGHPQISLQVFSENAPAQALYQKLGYQPEALLMKRSLKP